ncbi:hypothetical protein WOSG25_240040 [Weissella oryzae SG25]|uniref:Uncharacterized protein n=1 Tax=Weissella oryzae (strain DSM 25784 / JCM 18191 / LMG 30913 / SG25) TaxID=1329250 RepID=A0A069CW36_WEIOS|nr:HK97 gp10 family phage protein [Weissella oryzae]GAK32015.1 hypothetical protein WOSG25_240040 [Weissella oryzae SG25]
MPNDFESMTSNWLKNVGNLVNLTIEERETITGAGAEVVKRNIAEVTKAKHYQDDRDTTKMKHLADSVVSGKLEKTRADGSTAVGFSTRDVNHARIARFLNDGTVKRPGDSFYDQAVSNSQNEATIIQAKVLENIQGKKSL